MYRFELIETVRLEKMGGIASIKIEAIITNISKRKIIYELPKSKLKVSPPLPAYHPGSYLIEMPKMMQQCEWAGNRETGKLWMFAFIRERDVLPYWFTYSRNKFPLESGESITFKTTAKYIKNPRFSSWASSIRSGYKSYYKHLKPRPAEFKHKFRLSTPLPGIFMRACIQTSRAYNKEFELGNEHIYEWDSDSETEIIRFKGSYGQVVHRPEALKFVFSLLTKIRT